METILNDIADRVGIVPFLTGIVFIIAALILMRFPPKEINYLYGYRTPASMKNQQAWDFSQRFSAVRMFWIGIALLAFSFLNPLIGISQDQSLFLGIGFMIAGCIYMIVVTEKAIKKNFPNE